jgi:hypothetical protein
MTGTGAFRMIYRIPADDERKALMNIDQRQMRKIEKRG